MTLVLTRREGQQIQVGADVLITVVGVHPDGSVRVGIDAPRNLRITRLEKEPA